MIWLVGYVPDPYSTINYPLIVQILEGGGGENTNHNTLLAYKPNFVHFCKKWGLNYLNILDPDPNPHSKLFLN